MNAFTSEAAEKAVNSGRGGDSIHYRPTGYRRNTMKFPDPATKARLIAALTGHCVRHPNDRQSVNRLDRLEAQANGIWPKGPTR